MLDHRMIGSTAVTLLVAALFAYLARGRPISKIAAGSGVLGLGLFTYCAWRMPVVFWEIPSVWLLLETALAVQLLVASVAVTAGLRRNAPPAADRAALVACLVVALAAAAVLALGVVRSRGRSDELTLHTSACARGPLFGGHSETFSYDSHGYRAQGRVVPVGAAHDACSLVVTGPSPGEREIFTYDGATYGGTPECGYAEVVLCGREGVVLLEDDEQTPYIIPGGSRRRGFLLPDMLPFKPTSAGIRVVFGPPRTLLALAALGLAIALAGAAKRWRAAAVLGAMLAVPLAVVLLT